MPNPPTQGTMVINTFAQGTMVINTFAQGTRVMDTFGTILLVMKDQNHFGAFYVFVAWVLLGLHMNNILFIKPWVYPIPKQRCSKSCC
jgi:hypothetical protein